MTQSAQPPPGQHPGAAMLAFVLTKSPRLAPIGQIIETLRQRLPNLGAVEPPDSLADPDKDMLAHSFSLKGDLAIVAGIPAAYSWTDLEGPCQTAWWWPEAEQSLRDHTHHFLCSLMGEPNAVTERVVLLTHLVAAVSEHSDAVGIYWVLGTIVHEPAAFREAADGVIATHLAPHLWVDIRVITNGDSTCDLVTTGLRAFGLMELECERCPWPASELFEFAVDLANYLITRRESIADEETVGRTGDEKITVRHRPSRWDRPEVLHLEFS